MFEILILSFIQGVTEFLPVSSSSHLIIFSEYLEFENQSLSIDVSVHIGSFLAVIVFFYKDILNFFENKELFVKILLSSIPVMLVGFILVETKMIDEIRNIKTISWMTLIFGILLYISDKCKLEKNIKSNFDYRSVFLIGLLQVLSLIPGVSRSGITITAARLLKFERYDSAKISFLLSIPTLGAISIFGIKNIIFTNDASFTALNFFSIFLSFIFSLVTIRYFLKYIKKFSLIVFVIYRIILGAVLIYFAYL
tara:strand:+ start:4624 stop:5382 length:759 start_codon:yes stop_codon:yes gene_type:complete